VRSAKHSRQRCRKDDDADGFDYSELPAQKVNHGHHLYNDAGDAEDGEGTNNYVKCYQEDDYKCKKKRD